MNYIEMDPKRLKVINNYALVEFLDDDVEKLSQKIVILKQNNSTKLRSIYVGKILEKPNFIYGDATKEYTIPLDNLIIGETVVAYNPMSIQTEVTWKNKKYHLIRAEDIYCILENWVKTEIN